MKRPNFFIIGAPKCGTTSLAKWLSEHPNIYMSPVKEPHHFNDDEREGIRFRKHYEELFEAATADHMAIGEASTHYLFSKVAVQNILTYSPDAKFIIMLRNPVEMAPAWQEQLFFSRDESEERFESAWQLQEARAGGQYVPPTCLEPQLLQYGEYCKLGHQVERLLKTVDRARCLFLFLEVMKKVPGTTYQETLRFLEVPDDMRNQFVPVNEAKERKSRLLATSVRALGVLRRRIGITTSRGFILAKAIDNWNNVKRPRSALSLETKRMLIGYFREDIELLQFTLGKDLRHWLSE